MKKLLTAIFLCLCFFANAQTKTGFSMIKFDTTQFKPVTVAGDPNYIGLKSSGGGGGLDSAYFQAALNLKVDSVKRIADSVFYYTAGTKHFAFLDSVGTATADFIQSVSPTATITHTVSGLGDLTSDVNNNSIVDAKIASGINSNKIGSGDISNTEWQELNGISSNIQNQLDLKADSITKELDSVFYYANGNKNFAFLDSSGGAGGGESLSQTLAIGNTSSGNWIMMSDADYITSADGSRMIELNDSYISIRQDLGFTLPNFYMDANFWQIGSATTNRFIHSDANSTHNKHDVLVELDAPNIQFNQQTGAGTSMATLSATGILGRAAIPTGTLTGSDTISLSNRINLKKDITDSTNAISGYTTLYQNSLKQNQLNGTGFVKASGTTISYDNSTYLTAIDTTNITDFYLKVRRLFSVGTGMNYVTDDGIFSLKDAIANGSTKGAASYVASDFDDNGNGIISIDATLKSGWDAKKDNLDSTNAITGYTTLYQNSKKLNISSVGSMAYADSVLFHGNTHIVTLGTIGTGLWQGTAIDSTYLTNIVSRLRDGLWITTTTSGGKAWKSNADTATIASYLLRRSDSTSVYGSYYSVGLKAPLASPTFTGTVTIPTPFTLGATSVTTTGTKLNYLTSATGTTGTASTNVVFSTSPTITNLVLSAGSTSLSPILFTLSGASNLTSAVAGALEVDSNGIPYYTHATSERGVIDAEQFTTLTAAYTLTSQTAAQNIFNTPTNGRVTVASSKTYFFECVFSLSAMSASSGTFGFAIGGTATLTSIMWQSSCTKGSIIAGAATATNTAQANAANTAISLNNTSTTGTARITGIIRINAGGTIIPQVSFSTVAGAATPIVGINSYFRLTPVGTNTVVSVGNWD